MKSKLSDLLKGFSIGLIVTIPGFSIGTLAIILNIYERLINDLSDIVKHPLKIIKKDLLLGLGFIIGFIIDIMLISYLLTNFPLETVCLFIGLVFTTIIPTFNNGYLAKKEKMNNDANCKNKSFIFEIITCAISLTVLIFVTLLNAGINRELNLSFGFIIAMILCGVVGAGFMIIPGISGSLIVLSLGYYDSIINSLKGIGNCIISGDYTDFNVYFFVALSFLVGAIIGIICISKILKKLLEKCASYLYFGILGLLIGTPFSIIFLTISKYEINWHSAWTYVISFITLLVGIIIGIIINKYEKNSDKKENK